MADNLAEKLLKYPSALGRFCIIIINNIYCIPTYVVWMGLLLPLKQIHPDTYYKIEGVLFHWLLAVVSMWSYSAGYDIVEVGDDIEECRKKKTLIIANHQSTADVPLLMANFNAKEGVLPNIMWIMDRLFKYTNFGIVSIIHQDFFIASGKNNRDQSIEELKQHIRNSFIKRNRKWMVLFPEGGFLRKRREVSQKYAKKNDLPHLEHVTLPRVGAMKAIMDVMVEQAEKNECMVNENLIEKPENSQFISNITNNTNKNINNKPIKQSDKISYDGKGDGQNDSETNTINEALNKSSKENVNNKLPNGNLISKQSSPKDFIGSETCSSNNNKNSANCLLEYILDITIAYPKAIPLDLPNIVHGLRRPCTTYMLYRLYKVSNIPKESEALTKWLYDRFVEKEQLLERFYKTGQFYLDRTMDNGQVIQQDILRFILINLFFITSTYFHYQLFTSFYTYCLYLAYGSS